MEYIKFFETQRNQQIAARKIEQVFINQKKNKEFIT